MPGILEGIRVVDWTILHVGPSAGAMLADLGAEVIHVEERGRGDPMRGNTAFFGTNLMLPGGRQVLFEDLNRNKKSLAVDLKKPEGRQVVYRLVEKSDVFISNIRLQGARKLGMDYETLKTYNPRIIYGHCSAFGEKGPMAEAPGIEPTGYAASGAMLASGEEGMPPIYLATGIGDRIGGIYLAYGVIAGLLARERFGIVQEIKTSQLGAMIALQSASVITALLTGKEIARQQRARARNPLVNWYRCRDGRWIVLGMFQSQRYWAAFCEAMGMPELATDPRFDTDEKRAENCEALVETLDSLLATRTYQEWEQPFREKDLLFARVNTIGDLPTDPQVRANDYVVDWEHPAVGKWKAVGFPVRWTKTPAVLHSPAPEFGQHTEEILSELLGYSWEEIAGLKDREAI